MTSDSTFVIVGGGLAGAKLAEALRQNDFDGDIVLCCGEEHLPYERPPLSKEHMTGTKRLADFTPFDADWYRDNRIDVRPGTVIGGIDLAAHTVALPDDSTLRYDKLALATGSRPRRLSLPGAQAAGVHHLRTIDQSDALIGVLSAGTRLVVVGGGWIGLEVASSARQLGAEVAVLEAAAQPLLGALGAEMGAVFADVHREHGVDLRLGTEISSITVEDGRANGVVLADGSTLAADYVLVAVGAVADIEIAQAAGLDVGDGGVLVDASLAASDPDVVAVGDIAAQDHPLLGARVRVEHWANALNQPAVAARTMLGLAAAYDRTPYFFTDQYDLGMEYRGFVPRTGYDAVIVRGDTGGAREFLTFWLDADDVVLAAMNVNVWDAGADLDSLVRDPSPVSRTRLADPAVPLSDVRA
ncbi:FAD-dependent oxidoreductase [Rhodococcus sp. HNM0569]|uniref:NAD(P)/FAD-dependent oxidoreductase n=1 Tax=Rhodococcus sp. HNM0569 TaxID=2716340 RepID=UPI00146F3558|nr:FAD-dependent oxidoreductase [Rhodococcus sp. HNM0569]NLU84003.1 FAD-dependent oxidoreductase [Rhodococcus sp. HNM0569]